MSADRILVLAHGHPELSIGGGEIAAYAVWQELRRRGVEAMFLARSAAAPGHEGTPFSARSADGRELLFHAPPVDHFKHSQTHRPVVYEHFASLLRQFRPTAVHFHHYVHLGLELIREVRRYSATVPIIVTLHDYLGICDAHGQMLKSDGTLCRRSAPLDCNLCRPGHSPQDFFMRELFIKSFFNLVDKFISPSQFLADRYIQWGLPADRIEVLENGLKETAPAVSSGEQATDDLHTRFVVLGQLTRLKGTHLIFDAVRALPASVRRKIRIDVHGTMQYTDEAFQRLVLQGQTDSGRTVRYCGPYFPDDVGQVAASGGWVIVPSIWWENSPLVIQEAYRAGRPVICSNIGGMAEKVRNNVDGMHFMVGSATDLARRIEQAATDPALWRRMCAAIKPPLSLKESVERLLYHYRGTTAETAVAPKPQKAR